MEAVSLVAYSDWGRGGTACIGYEAADYKAWYKRQTLDCANIASFLLLTEGAIQLKLMFV